MMKKLVLSIAISLSLTEECWSALNAHWKLQDNAASTTVVATVGSNGTLTGAGNTSASTGTPGPGTLLTRYLSFDGTDDRVVASTSNGGIVRNKAVVTLCCWFKVAAADTTGLHCLQYASVNGSGNARASIYINSTGQLISYARAGDAESAQNKVSTNSYDDDSWHHAAVVINYASDTITIYVDGSSVAQTGTISFTAAATSDTDSTNVILASSVSTERFKGKLADCRFYDSNESSNLSAIIAEKDLTGLIDPLSSSIPGNTIDPLTGTIPGL